MSKRNNYRKINEEVNVLLSVGKKTKNNNNISGNELDINVNEINVRDINNIEVVDNDNLTDFFLDFDDNISECEVSASESEQSGDNIDFAESEVNLENDLAEWMVKHKTTNESGNDLLKLLRKFHPHLPKDVRTLKRTPKQNNIVGMGGGSYVHFGLKNSIEKLINREDNINAVAIDIGIDGLPLSKSSSSQLWPILGNIVGKKDVFVIGAYHGYKKPFCADTFLDQFVEEIVELKSNGILHNNLKIAVDIRAIVCDAPAKSMILGVKGHSGYYGCTKCEVKGEYLEKRVAFTAIDEALRTDEKFTKRKHAEYHKKMGPIALERVPIGCVSQIPVDYMHCVLLGVVQIGRASCRERVCMLV